MSSNSGDNVLQHLGNIFRKKNFKRLNSDIFVSCSISVDILAKIKMFVKYYKTSNGP